MVRGSSFMYKGTLCKPLPPHLQLTPYIEFTLNYALSLSHKSFDILWKNTILKSFITGRHPFLCKIPFQNMQTYLQNKIFHPLFVIFTTPNTTHFQN